MKKLVIMLGISLCLGNINAKIMSNDDIKKAFDECIKIQEGQKQICQKYIDSGLQSTNNCNKDTCLLIGIIYKNAGHFNQAEKYYNQAMALGNNSYVSFGDLYETQNNISKAKKYYKIGCDRTDYTSCDKLGSLYMSSKEYPIAKKYWEIACDGGDSFSCNKLFMMYFRGDGIKQNLALSKKYCAKMYDKKSCSSVENLISSITLANQINQIDEYNLITYRIDNNVNDEFKRLFNNVKNGDKELSALNLALMLNALETDNVPSVDECDKDTCYELGGFYLFGGQSGGNTKNNLIKEAFVKIQDTDKAIKYIKKAIDLGNILGYEVLGMIYRDKNDISAAKYYYNLGCEKGEYTSCNNIGWLYKNEKDYKNAKKYLELACSKNNKDVDSKIRSCGNLGDMYQKGLGVLHSYQKAVEYYKIACDLKSAFSCALLAGIYAEGGINVKQDFSIAKQYAGKACNLGMQEACEVYKMLNEAGVK